MISFYCFLTIFFAVLAFILVIKKVSGWGWFLFCAILASPSDFEEFKCPHCEKLITKEHIENMKVKNIKTAIIDDKEQKDIVN